MIMEYGKNIKNEKKIDHSGSEGGKRQKNGSGVLLIIL